MRQIGADDEVHRHADGEQSGAREKASPDPEEPAAYSDDESDDDQVEGVDMRAGDEEVHGLTFLRRISFRSAVVQHFQHDPLRIISARATVAYNVRF